MPETKRTFRFLVFLLLFLSASGCDLFDKDQDVNTPGAVGAPSGSTIDIGGGEGNVDTGGDGGQDTGIWLENNGPAGLKIYATGTADASFTFDAPAATPDLGAEPLLVDTDLPIPVYDDPPMDNNAYYFLRNDSTLYHKVDDSTINTVTGIRVAAGATLTIGINADLDYNGLYESASLDLENDVEILGTLRTAAFSDGATQDSGDPKDRAGLALSSTGNMFIRASGVVSTAGDNAATGRGGHGGAILIAVSPLEGGSGGSLVNDGLIDASGGSTGDPGAEGGNSAAYGSGLYLYGAVLYSGTGAVRADGGSGATGGYAGGWNGNSFYIGSDGAVQNTGAISISGGTGTDGDGGTGGSLEIGGGVSLHNSGAIAVRGGDGTLNGGPGGTVNLYVNIVGDILNSGAVDARGGESTGTDNSATAYGGAGGQVYLATYGGRLISSGPIDADGGGVANANAGSSGGQGGYVDIESYIDYSGEGAPAGDMEISGNILARGGAGPNGGYGGGVYMYYDDSNGTGGIVLRGYSSLAGNGGRGVGSGGGGGGVYLYDSYGGGVEGSGGLVTEADISANGGGADQSTGSGGSGGSVELSSSVAPSQYRGVTVDGGAGAFPGGEGTISIDGGGGPI